MPVNNSNSLSDKILTSVLVSTGVNMFGFILLKSDLNPNAIVSISLVFYYPCEILNGILGWIAVMFLVKKERVTVDIVFFIYFLIFNLGMICIFIYLKTINRLEYSLGDYTIYWIPIVFLHLGLAVLFGWEIFRIIKQNSEG